MLKRYKVILELTEEWAQEVDAQNIEEARDIAEIDFDSSLAERLYDIDIIAVDAEEIIPDKEKP